MENDEQNVYDKFVVNRKRFYLEVLTNQFSMKFFKVYYPLCAVLMACGGTTEQKEGFTSIEAVPKSTTISGPFNKDLESVGNAKVEIVKEGLLSEVAVKIQLKSLKESDGTLYGLKYGNDGPLYVDLLDKQGVPVTGWEAIPSTYKDDDKIKHLLTSELSNEWIVFRKFTEGNAESIPTQISSYALTSKKIEESSSSGAVDDGNIDDLLDSYESYMDQYVKTYNEAKEGNSVEAMSEYSELLEKAQELANKLENVKGEMTSNQIKRMSRIQNKMQSIKR